MNMEIEQNSTNQNNDNRYCPLCRKTLVLNHINLTTAIYMCLDLNCQYPVGFDCFVVHLPIEPCELPRTTLQPDYRPLQQQIPDQTINQTLDNSSNTTNGMSVGLENSEDTQQTAGISSDNGNQPTTTDTNNTAVDEMCDFDEMLEFLLNT